MDDALKLLHKATLLVAGRGDLDDVLQQIVHVARDLLGAEYAALGVPNNQDLLDAFIYSGISAEEASKIGNLPRGLGLLGAIITERKTIRLDSIQADSRSIGFPENHPMMKSFLGVPVIGEGKPLGNLYLCNKIGSDRFSAVDEELAEMFAAHAAIAIQNARIDEEIQRLAILDERTRIGMDLHDGIIQSIYAVGLLLENSRFVLDEDPAEAEALIAQSIDGLNDSIRDIRNFILDLRPHRYGGDLIAGVNRLAQEFQANSMVAVTVDMPVDGLQKLPPKIGRTLFLTVQNGLANVARHAKATQTEIKISREEGHIKLVVADNGVGFEPTWRGNMVGHGLHNMQARADQLNGRFKIESVIGEGTRIELLLPMF